MIFQSSKFNFLSDSLGYMQRTLDWGIRVSLGAYGSTAFNLHTSGEASALTHYLHSEQMCQEPKPPDPVEHDEWSDFTEGQGSSCILYPTLAWNTDAWCQFPYAIGLGDGSKDFWQARTSLWSSNLNNHDPWTVNPQPSPATFPQMIQPQRSYKPHFHSPPPRYLPKALTWGSRA